MTSSTRRKAGRLEDWASHRETASPVKQSLITFLGSFAVATASLLPGASRALAQDKNSPWSFDATIYGLAAGMTGDIGAGPVNADVDVGFSDIWDNLEFGAMGKLRLGYERWSLNVDVIYMGLGVSKDRVSADLDQWVVEPSVGYRFNRYVEVLAGTRYNNLAGEIRGPGVLPSPIIAVPSQDWWDPIVGANLTLPFAKKFSFNVRGDIGGFGVGSDLTWQAFPFFNWQVSRSFSVQAGYRLVYTDYETGSGPSRFRYDMLTHGPQLGATLGF